MDLIRDIHPDTLAALSRRTFNPAVLIDVDWPRARTRVHSGIGTMTWNAHSWIGTAGRGALNLPNEAAGAASVEGFMRLGGTPEMIAQTVADADAARGRSVSVWFAVVTQPLGTAVIGAPIPVWTGIMGGASWSQSFEGDYDTTDEITVELLPGPSQRASGAALHSWDDQRALDPSDTAGRWVEAAFAAMFAEALKL